MRLKPGKNIYKKDSEIRRQKRRHHRKKTHQADNNTFLYPIMPGKYSAHKRALLRKAEQRILQS